MQHPNTRYFRFSFRSILMGIVGLFLFFSIQSSSTYALTGDCTQWQGGTIADGATVYGYSTVLWSVTGQNYPNGCTPFSGALSCVNGSIQGNPSFFSYTFAQCNAGLPQSCTTPRGTSIPHGTTVTGYAMTGTLYPNTCDMEATALSCVNGNLQGNRQTYIHPSCTQIDPLFNGTDIEILPTFSGLPGGGTSVAQGSSPMITLALRNNGTNIINTTAGPGFLSCLWLEQNISLYTSPVIGSLVINPGTKIGLPIQLSNIFSQALGTKTIRCTVSLQGDQQSFNNTWQASISVIKANRFDLAMEKSISSIKSNLEPAEAALGTQGIQNFVFSKVMSFLVPLIVVLGILIAIIGFYKLMFSSDDKAVGEGTRYIIYGAIGIILIMSAKYIGSSLYSIITPSSGAISGYQIAQQLYDQIAFPFIKFAIYLVLGAMFVILLTRVISFIFGSDSDARKKAGTLIGRNIIGMLVIIGAKQIVEAVYGKQADVIKDISNLGEIGSGILADKQIPLIYQVVNWVLGLTALIILIIIIVQTIQLLIKPSDEKQMASVKRSIIYMLIGLLIIGTGYVIVNFLILN